MAESTDKPEAEVHWEESRKILHSMLKTLDQMDKEKEESSNKRLAELEAVEKMLENLRLTSMTCTFTDFHFAHEKNVLGKLWHVHTLVIGEYKKCLQRHRGHGQIVQFRNIEKQYSKHLKTAQYFYKGFIERLSARYSLPPLQRIAHLTKSSAMQMDEVISADDARLRDQLTTACYRTLLHLGDLARYRLSVQSRQKGHSNPAAALTYYSLAQDLMPHEGDAHNQMAVVLSDQCRDFDVVYHSFRAWSVKHQNQLASKNLTSEFKKLMQPPSSSRKSGNAPPDPYDTFGSWFVRLHAHYFKGEAFSAQAELEREVIHRWEVLLKSAQQPEYLQKAILINIAAYDVALKKIKTKWTNEGSRSCQFILLFHVRMILTLSRVLESLTDRLFTEDNSQDEEKPKTSNSRANGRRDKGNESSNNGANNSQANNRSNNSNNKQHQQQPKKTSPANTSLALFRICMAWISIYHGDLVTFKEHLAPHIDDMHESVTKCLSLFVAMLPNTEASPAEYLLPEDTEIVGLEPLDCWEALFVSGSSTLKPRFDDADVKRLSAVPEALARLYNVVESTVKLVSDDSFPWKSETVEEDGKEVTKICYTEQKSEPFAGGPVAGMAAISIPLTATPSQTATAKSPPAARSAAQTPPTASSSSPGQRRQGSRNISSKQQPQKQQNKKQQRQQKQQRKTSRQDTPASPEAKPVSYPPANTQSIAAIEAPTRQPTREAFDAAPDAIVNGKEHEKALKTQQAMPFDGTDMELNDPEAVRRVQHFLSPPEVPEPLTDNYFPAQLPQSSNQMPIQAQPSSSYGMHTATANEIFAGLDPQQQQQQQQSGSFMAARATRSGSGPAKPIPSQPWDVYTPTSSFGLQPPIGSKDSPTRERFPSSSAAPATASASRYHSGFMDQGLSSLSIENRNGFPSMLSPVGAAATGRGQASPPQMQRNIWAQPQPQLQQVQQLQQLQAPLERQILQQLQQEQAASLGLAPGSTFATAPGIRSSGGNADDSYMYSSNFSGTSSMPSVQSPMGLPQQRTVPVPVAQDMAATGSSGFPGSSAVAGPSSYGAHSYWGPQQEFTQQQQQQQQQQGYQQGQQAYGNGWANASPASGWTTFSNYRQDPSSLMARMQEYDRSRG